MASEGPQESDRNPVVKDGHLPVNEMLGEYQGANSPFGDDRRFPLPVEKITYVHPDPDAVAHD
jgi:succinate dehydrogenase / fumarate reductase iron-sulfur subunit